MYTDPSFRMTVEDVFAIRGRGTVVTGRIEMGEIRVGNEIYVHGAGVTKTAVIHSIEMFRKQQPQAQAGDRIGLRLTNFNEGDIQRGDLLSGTA